MVCSFLDAQSLSAMEAAGLDRCCSAPCWMALLAAVQKDFTGKPLWKPEEKPAPAANPKEALRKLKLWLQNLARVPKPWATCIRKISDTDIEIRPRLRRAASAGCRAHHGGTEDYVCPDEGAGTPEEPRLEPPNLAGVPLAVGCLRGEPMSVRVLLTSEKLSHVGEAFLLGVEHVSRKGTVTPVYFSPVSGRIFVRFPNEHEGLVAQPMPALTAASAEADSQEVEAFVLVDGSGCISFGRRRGPSGGIEWSGEIEPEFFPPSTVECFASLTFQIDQLKGPARISVVCAGNLPPASVVHDNSLNGFTAVWSVHEW